MKYAKLSDRDLIVSHKQSHFSETYEKLPPGIYKTQDIGGMLRYIPAYEPLQIEDGLIKFKSGVFGDVVNACRKFFDPETVQKYQKLEILQKMGIILYGPPGTGKTCTAQLVMQELSSLYGAVCFDMTGKKLSWIKLVIKEVRENQDSPIVIFVDEAEDSFRSSEDEYLTFLDGTDSVKNMIFIGCTNHIEKISDRIVKRRSRIKHTILVKSLPDQVYREYITSKLPELPKETVDKFIYCAMEAALNIDEFKHAVIDYYIEDATIEDAIDNVKKYYTETA